MGDAPGTETATGAAEIRTQTAAGRAELRTDGAAERGSTDAARRRTSGAAAGPGRGVKAGLAGRLERIDAVVVGGGQAGLATGYQLKRRGVRFVVLEADARIGDVWRRRWDSLRLFTPAAFDALPGMPFPAPPHSFPTKDEMADYLERYAAAFELPVRTGARVTSVTRTADEAGGFVEGSASRGGGGGRSPGGFLVETADGRHFLAENVVVAMANYQEPWLPEFAARLDPDLVQVHSREYRNPSQLRPGGVLLVGAGNSAAEIARELAPRHRVWVSGRDVGELPFRVEGFLGRHLLVRLVLRVLFYRVLSVDTPVGRGARRRIVGHGGPLIRVKRAQLADAGVEFVGRTAGAKGGMPVLEDGRVLDVENVVWCTGFRPGFERWLHLPVHGEHEPRHQRGQVADQPGLYFVGLHFQRSLASAMIHGVGRDAAEIARAVARRTPGAIPA